ncbi:polyprenyl diphosphate synthase [uncultured Maritimibacter sp.]|jgi:undecaprenyl diphosphate synthase|uniref:polyprenyl diphosphate synthase n=1 Tax=uncultured Maritimibacter sp. TaxID=991866 RepID=UPI000A6757E1|nr:polyprenyl diphosphate synthase [uncultured Maritimibacter sp.]
MAGGRDVNQQSQIGPGRDLHVAFIMDGNGRWAKARRRPRPFGHQAGAKRAREVVEACPDLGVKYVTLYAFSTENWKRSKPEIIALMALFRHYIRKTMHELHAEGARVRFIGDRAPLDRKLVALIQELEALTARNDRVHVTVALNYGGRDEILRATRKMAQAVIAGQLRPEDIGEDTMTHYLDTAGLPDPDLVVRTSGEARTSNFLTWQSAYAEYEFTDTLWPDFGRAEFAAVLDKFGLRERRFGGVTG